MNDKIGKISPYMESNIEKAARKSIRALTTASIIISLASAAIVVAIPVGVLTAIEEN